MKRTYLIGLEIWIYANGTKTPLFFFEPRGSYARTWRCRWQRIACRFGLHKFMLLVPSDPPEEFCGLRSPFCTKHLPYLGPR